LDTETSDLISRCCQEAQYTAPRSSLAASQIQSSKDQPSVPCHSTLDSETWVVTSSDRSIENQDQFGGKPSRLNWSFSQRNKIQSVFVSLNCEALESSSCTGRTLPRWNHPATPPSASALKREKAMLGQKEADLVGFL
jgi:hypothetical protein